MGYDSEPLCRQTNPLRKSNTHNHNQCVTLMENICGDPVLIRVSPYMEYHSKPLCGQTANPRDLQLTQEVNEYFKEPRLEKSKSGGGEGILIGYFENRFWGYERALQPTNQWTRIGKDFMFKVGNHYISQNVKP